MLFTNHADRRGDHIYGSAYRSTASADLKWKILQMLLTIRFFYDVDTVSKVAKSIYANKYINDFLEMEYRDPFDYVVSYQEFFKDTLFPKFRYDRKFTDNLVYR